MDQGAASGKNRLITTAPSEKPSGYTTTTAYEQMVSKSKEGLGQNTRGTRGRGLNFKLIADVLAEEAEIEGGLDLSQAIVNALKGNKLDEKTKLLAQLELLQYLQPKMKAVEHKGKVELDSETVESRLAYLLSKLGVTGGVRSEQADGVREAGTDRPVEAVGDGEEA
jgi:hypothetical protein